MGKGSFMKGGMIAVLSAVALLFCNPVQLQAASVEGSYDKMMREHKEKEARKLLEKRAEKSKSIWDDDAEANPYFKQKNKNKGKKEKASKEKKAKEPRRSTFKRRTYTGPSKDEIAETATKKAIENFNQFASSDTYGVKYSHISYNVSGDSLSVNDVLIIPKKTAKDTQPPVPYLMKAKEIILKRFNIGEVVGKPMTDNGEMVVRKMEIPVWDDKAVKKGKIDIAQLKMKGDIPTYLKEKEGEIDILELRDFRSETIINETILNNIIRSKVFAASSANLMGVELQKTIVDALKQQELDGLKFASARINNIPVPSLEGVKAAMTSYSARILNTDLVLGARLEAKKEKPSKEPDLELLKKNVEENKAAIAAVEAEASVK